MVPNRQECSLAVSVVKCRKKGTKQAHPKDRQAGSVWNLPFQRRLGEAQRLRSWTLLGVANRPCIGKDLQVSSAGMPDQGGPPLPDHMLHHVPTITVTVRHRRLIPDSPEGFHGTRRGLRLASHGL
jgi:hypothetical protein